MIKTMREAINVCVENILDQYRSYGKYETSTLMWIIQSQIDQIFEEIYGCFERGNMGMSVDMERFKSIRSKYLSIKEKE